MFVKPYSSIRWPAITPLVLAVFCFVVFVSAHAAERGAVEDPGEVSLTKQIEVLLGALSFSKSATDGKDSEAKFTIAIVHDRNVAAKTLKATKAAFEKNSDLEIKGRRISAVILPFRHARDLKKKIVRLKADAVYIPSGNERSVRIILSITRRLDRVSFTCVPDFVHWRGVTLGVDASSGEPKLMVNLAGCRDENVEFGEEVLSDAQVFF